MAGATSLSDEALRSREQQRTIVSEAQINLPQKREDAECTYILHLLDNGRFFVSVGA